VASTAAGRWPTSSRASGVSAPLCWLMRYEARRPDAVPAFWYYNTSKRSITLNLETADGRGLFLRLAETVDVILETFRPGFLASLGLDYEALRKQSSGLIMCALTPFGQTGPWRDYLSSDLLHMAAGGEMASSGYDEADMPNAPPIAPGGGNAWHTAGHFAYMAIVAALVYRTVAGQGQYIDAAIHEACALTTEAAIANYVYRGEVVRRQTGRHHAAGPTPRTQFRAKDGTYVCALVAGRLTPKYIDELADLLDTNGMGGDLRSGIPNTRIRRSLRRTRLTSSMTWSPISSPACRQRRSITPPNSADSLGGRCVLPRRFSTTPISMIAASGKRWRTRNLGAASSTQARRPSITALLGGSPDGRR
jgi:crotonobetainyl-CoA:carnitine CoA-transferase CaiB-like acyl-CoA transferase